MFLQQVFILGAVGALLLGVGCASVERVNDGGGRGNGAAVEEEAVPFIPPLPGAAGS